MFGEFVNFDFRSELDDLAERIRRSPMLDLLAFDVRPPRSQEWINEVENRLGSALPATVRELYSSLDRATLRWRFKPDLDEPVRGRVSEEFSQAVTRNNLFNVAGAIDVIPLDDMLFSEECALPRTEPDCEFDFEGITYSDNAFCAMLRPFDTVSEFFAMAFVVQPGRTDWKMMWLSDYWIEHDCSRVTYLQDYLRYIIATWGLENARDELLSAYRGDRLEPLYYDPNIAAARMPQVLQSAC